MSGRLAAVLRVRALAERAAIGALAHGERDLRRAEAAVAERRAAYRARPAPGGPLDPVALRALQLQGLGAHDLVRAAVEDRDAVALRRDDLERAWSLASVRRKSAERLAERRAAEAVAAARSAEQHALDELAVLRRRLP